MLRATSTFALLFSIWSFLDLTDLSAQTLGTPQSFEEYYRAEQAERERKSLAEAERKSFEKYAAEQEAERERTRQASRREPNPILQSGRLLDGWGKDAAERERAAELERTRIRVAIILALVLFPFILTVKRWWPPLRRHPSRFVGIGLLVLGSGFLVGGLVDSSGVGAAVGTMMLVSGYLLFQKEKAA